jgi:hypothetical protein
MLCRVIYEAFMIDFRTLAHLHPFFQSCDVIIIAVGMKYVSSLLSGIFMLCNAGYLNYHSIPHVYLESCELYLTVFETR